ncbi:hypothetical protein [Thalassotalea insulae]|nr:hypothetical protein [Thalassotalea insulae]
MAIIISTVSCLTYLPAASASSESITVNIHTDNLNDFLGITNQAHNSALSVTTNQLLFANLAIKLNFNYMTTQRSTTQMDEGENICLIDRIKTPLRASKYLFSLPVNLYLSRRFYQNIHAPVINDPELLIDGALDLLAFFKKYPDKKLLLSHKISYGNALDNLLANLPDKNKTYRRGAAHETAIVDMLVFERVNYTLLYPQQISEQNIKTPLRSYEIAGIPPFVAGRLMCTNSAEMQLFIEKVNQTLKRLYDNKILFNAHLTFIPDEYADVLAKYFHQATTETMF